MTEKTTGLDLLRTPFPPEQIGKLPRITCKPCRDARPKTCAQHKPVRCGVCANYISSAHIHLDYVGHAALTDRLLDADPQWTWEPLALDERGLPAFDRAGGLWIRLTVAGVTRLGYGDAQGKTGGDAVKEAIGDALRNAAMRFGAALDLWHKGDLHAEEPEPEPARPTRQAPKKQPAPATVPTPADNMRNAIREFATERGWDLHKVAAAFESEHDQELRSCQDVELLHRYMQTLESEAQIEAEAAQRAEDAAAADEAGAA